MHSALQSVRNVWSSPLNRKNRLLAVSRATFWHLWKKKIRRPLVRTIFDDIQFVFYPDAEMANLLMLWGESFFDYPFKFFERFLQPGDHFLDAGANVGLYSLFASRQIGKGKVFCVEPGATQLERLRKHLNMNQIPGEIFPYAVSNEAKRLAFSREDVVSCVIADSGEPPEGAYEFVEAKRLDEFIPRQKYALMKLDVEGFELPAMEGASGLIREGLLPAIIFEHNRSGERYGVTNDTLTRFFRDKGYTLGVYHHQTNQFDTTSELSEDVIALNVEGLAMLRERISGVQIV